VRDTRQIRWRRIRHARRAPNEAAHVALITPDADLVEIGLRLICKRELLVSDDVALKDIEADPMSTASDVRPRLQSHAPLSTARCRPCMFLSC
jgi:hypothetical protein